MISRKFTQNFLSRPLDSYEWLKKFDEKKVDNLLENLDPKPEFITEPRLHQKICFLIGIANPNFLFFLDVGAGKSKLALDLIRYHKKLGANPKAIIFVPNVVNIDGWIEQIQTHAHDLSYIGLTGGTEDRLDLLNSYDMDISIINYQGFIYLVSEKIKKAKAKNKQFAISKPKIDLLAEKFNFLVLDESQKCKSLQSLSYKGIRLFSEDFPNRYALTATPFGRDTQELWPQFNIIDHGETLGNTISLFRECYFDCKVNKRIGYREYSLKPDMENTLHKNIQHKSIRYRAEDCVDLPDVSYIVERVPFDSEAKKKYLESITEFREKDKTSEVKNIFLRMRQIVSGFIFYKDEDGDRIEIDFVKNPKFDYLFELIDSIPEDEKIIVFNEFIYSGDKICEALTKRGIKHSRLYSGTKNHSQELTNFSKDPKCRVMVANSQSGGTGLNLQIAKYCLFYETPVSPIIRKQAEGRIYRQGQTHDKVFIYDIIVKDSIEEKILLYLKEGRDLFEALIDGEEVL